MGNHARKLESPTKGRSPVQRRRLIGVAGSLAAGVATPTDSGPPERGRLGMSDVNRLRQPITQLIAIDGQQGGNGLPLIASQHAQRLLEAMENLVVSSRVENAAYTLAGEYLALAGWFAIDSEDLLSATKYLDQALRIASISGDQMLQAQIWNYMVMRARQAGAHNEAYAVARTGLRSGIARRNPKIAALFHARVANAHAVRGERALSARSLARANEALSRSENTSAATTPAWLAFVTESELAGLSAIAYNDLGCHHQAEEVARHALSQVAQPATRNRIHEILHIVDARLGLADAKQAAAEATQALEIAAQLRDGLKRGRIAGRLSQIRQKLATSPQQDALTWVEQYDHSLEVTA
jgi:tetratricopeptide (TPR) repeat protein